MFRSRRKPTSNLGLSQNLSLFCAPVCALFFFLVAALPVVAAPPQDLQARLDAVLKDVSKTSDAWGVVVYDYGKGEAWYERHAAKPLNLASNAKLITTAAALSEFGPDHHLETRVFGDVDSAGVVQGHLYVVGGADPRLLDSEVTAFAKALWAKGITKVRGGVRVDLGLFDDDTTPPAFAQKRTDAAYRPNIASLGALNNAIGIGFRPGASVGAPARVWLTPHNDYLILANSTKTVKGKKEALVVKAESFGDKTRIRISGTIGTKGRRGSVRRRVIHPGLFTGYVLRDAFRKAGIQFDDNSVVRGTPSAELPLLLSHSTGSVSEHVKETNLFSNNMMAEMLFKALNARRSGPPATWNGARDVVARFLAQAGLPVGSVQFINGSGLYRADFASPRQMVIFLGWAREQTDWGDAFFDSLPVSGVSGTLRGRMGGTASKGRIHAKTGTLNKVSTLSGYLLTKSGEKLSFSFLFNDIKTSVRDARRMQDRLCSVLASY